MGRILIDEGGRGVVLLVMLGISSRYFGWEPSAGTDWGHAQAFSVFLFCFLSHVCAASMVRLYHWSKASKHAFSYDDDDGLGPGVNGFGFRLGMGRHPGIYGWQRVLGRIEVMSWYQMCRLSGTRSRNQGIGGVLVHDAQQQRTEFMVRASGHDEFGAKGVFLRGVM
jgi:hypothetical protein